MTSVTPAEGDNTWLKKRSSLFNNTTDNTANANGGNVEKKVVDKELARLKNIGAVSSVWTNKFVQEDAPGGKRLSFGSNASTSPRSPTFNIRARRTLSGNNKDLAIQIATVLKDAKEPTEPSASEPQEALAAGKNDEDKQNLPKELPSTESAPNPEKSNQSLPNDVLLETSEETKQSFPEEVTPTELNDTQHILPKDTLAAALDECKGSLPKDVPAPNLDLEEKEKAPAKEIVQMPEETSLTASEDITQNLLEKASTVTLEDIKNHSSEDIPAFHTDSKENKDISVEGNTHSLSEEIPSADLEHDNQPSIDLKENEESPVKEGIHLLPEETPLQEEDIENSLSEDISRSNPNSEEIQKVPFKENTRSLPEETLTLDQVSSKDLTPETSTHNESAKTDCSLSKDDSEKQYPKEIVSTPSNVEAELLIQESISTEAIPETDSEEIKHVLHQVEESKISNTVNIDLDETASLWFQFETLKTQNAQMNARLNKVYEDIGFCKRQLEGFENIAEPVADHEQNNDIQSSKEEETKRYSSSSTESSDLDETTSLWFKCETLKTQNARMNARLNKANEDLEFYKRQLESLDVPSSSPVHEEITLEEKEVEIKPSVAPIVNLDEATSLWFQCETLKTQYAQINARFNKANEDIEFYKSQLESLDTSTRESLHAAAEERDKEVARVKQLAELITKQDALINEYEMSLESLNKSASETHSPEMDALRKELVDLYKKKDEMESAIVSLRAELEMAHSQMQLMMAVSTEIQNEFESYKQKVNYGINGMLADKQQEHENELAALEQKLTEMAAEVREREIGAVRDVHLQDLEALEKRLTSTAAEIKEREIASAHDAHLLEIETLTQKLTLCATEAKEREIAQIRDNHFQELQELEKRLTDEAREREIVPDVQLQEATEAKEREFAQVRDAHLQELQALEKRLTEAAIETREREIASANDAHSKELEALTQKLMAAHTEIKEREVMTDLHELESLRQKVRELTAVIEEKDKKAVISDAHLQELEFLRKRVNELTNEVEVMNQLNKDAANEREITLKVVLEQVAELKKLKEELCERDRLSKIPVTDERQDISKIVMEQVRELKKIKQELCERETLSRATLDEREIVSKIVLEQVRELKKLKDELCEKDKAVTASVEHSTKTIKSLQDQVVQLNNTLEQKDQNIAELKKQMEAQKMTMEAQITDLNQAILEKDAQLLENTNNSQAENDIKITANGDATVAQNQTAQPRNYVYTTSSDEEDLHGNYSTDDEEIQNAEHFQSFSENKPSTVMYESSDEEEKQATDIQRFSYSSFHSNSSAIPSTASRKEDEERKRSSVCSTSAVKESSSWPMPPPTPPPSEPLPPLPASPSEKEQKVKSSEPVPVAPPRRGRSQTMVREELPSPYTSSIHQTNELARIVPLPKESTVPVPPPRKDVKNPILESSSPLPQSNDQPLNTKWMDDPESEEEEHSTEAQLV